MGNGPSRRDDYYRQQVTDGSVDHVAHGDGPMDTSAHIEDTSEIWFQMEGTPPQNEEGNPRIARQLAEALTIRDGTPWVAHTCAPTGPERGIDWNLNDSRGTVRPVQITRVGPTERWSRVRATGVTGTVTVSEAAREIAQAIERKLPSQDAGTILALSVGQPGYYAFTEVVTEFKRTYLPQLRSIVRFAEIWLVGYSSETTIAVWPEDGRSDRTTG